MIILQNNPGIKYSRIISLVPSQTELLSYLGLEEEVIGITKFCIHPDKWFRNKTRIGGTKNINIKKIHQLSPDIIIANKEENIKEQIEELAEKYDVWVTDVNNFSEALDMIRDIGALVQREESAFNLILKLNEGFGKLKNSFLDRKKIPAAYFIWKDPYMVAGGNNFINDMMQYCGLENVFADHNRYPKITLAEIKEKNVELVLLSSEPYPFKEKHKEQIQKQVGAIKVELVDGEMFSWYGNRLLNSIDYFQTFVQKLQSNLT